MANLPYLQRIKKERPTLRSLQTLLTILDGQKLQAGYLPVFGSGTAYETCQGLMSQLSYYTLLSNPLQRPIPLFTPAWVASLKGKDAIYLDGVDGNLDLSQAQPAYIFMSPV